MKNAIYAVIACMLSAFSLQSQEISDTSFGKGLINFTAKDSSFSVKFAPRIQFRSNTFWNYNGESYDKPEQSFLIRRARLKFDGWALTPKLKYKIELGLSKYVRFIDWLPNDDLPQYLNSADIYVTTSLSDGSSVALMEAVSCGLPMVVTNVPAFHEWISNGQNGFIVPFGDSQEVAKRVIQILENPETLSEMRKNTLDIADKKADWDKNYKVLESVYNDIV